MNLPQPKGPPKMEFMQHGMKWIVENQGSSNGVVSVEVTDKKHQVQPPPLPNSIDAARAPSLSVDGIWCPLLATMSVCAKHAWNLVSNAHVMYVFAGFAENEAARLSVRCCPKKNNPHCLLDPEWILFLPSLAISWSNVFCVKHDRRRCNNYVGSPGTVGGRPHGGVVRTYSTACTERFSRQCRDRAHECRQRNLNVCSTNIEATTSACPSVDEPRCAVPAAPSP